MATARSLLLGYADRVVCGFEIFIRLERRDFMFFAISTGPM